MALPPFVRRVTENLDKEDDADLMLIAAVVLENARDFFTRLSSGPAAAELDAVYKPLIRVLIERSMGSRFTTPRGQA